jgi:hypothetical protein
MLGMARLHGYRRPPRGGSGRCRRASERTPSGAAGGRHFTNTFLRLRIIRTLSSRMRQDARHEVNWLRNPEPERLRMTRHAWGIVTRDDIEDELR